MNRKSPGRAAAALAAVLAVAAIAPLAALRAQNPQVPPDVDATIRAANAQKNHEMLERAASAYENLRKYDEARKLREAALAINAEVSGQQGPDYAASLVKLGDLAHRQGNHEEGDAYYRKAIELGDSPATAPALLALGLGFFSKDKAAALGYFQRALNADASGAPAGALRAGAVGPTAGPALTWTARVREDDDPGAAAVFYTLALSLEPDGSAARALTLEMLAHLITEHAALGDVKIQTLGTVTYSTQAAMLQEATAEARRIRTQRVADLSRPLMARDPGLQISLNGSGTVPPKLIAKREPEYSPEARALKVEGRVVLQVTVDVDGSARDIKLKQGLGFGLDEAAVSALSQWRFEPGTRGGVLVAVAATIEVNFRLL